MAITEITRQVEQLAVSAGDTVYTVPANTSAKIVHAVATNIDTTNAATITVQVNSGAGLANYVVARVIPAGRTDMLPEITGMVLEATDVLQAFAGTASDINLKVSMRLTT